MQEDQKATQSQPDNQPTSVSSAAPPIEPQQMQPDKHLERKVWIVVLVALVVTSSLAATGYAFLRNKTENLINKIEPAINEGKVDLSQDSIEPKGDELAPDTAFNTMLDKALKTKTYHLSVKHESGSYAESFAFSAQADVDVNGAKEPNTDGNFTYKYTERNATKEFEGNIVLLNDALYLKLARSNGQELGFTSLNSTTKPSPTLKNPTAAQLLNNWVKIPRQELYHNSGLSPNYQYVVAPFATSMAPFGDYPLAELSAEGKKRINSKTGGYNSGMYKVYDPKLVEHNGRRAYTYNVITSTTDSLNKVQLMMKELNIPEGAARLNYQSQLGDHAPGFFTTIWVDAISGELLQLQAKVEMPDYKSSTIMVFTNYNRPVSIKAPL